MKIILKLLLFLGIVFAGVYASTPLWLPYILSRQLPTGWQLEKLEPGYPGLSGINIPLLRVSGGLHAADISLAATDIRFSYQGLKTGIGSLSLDIFLRAAEDSSAEAFTLDDLSLPVIKPVAKLPELAVTQLRVALHQAAHIEPGNIVSAQPLVVNFEAFKLNPRSDGSFYLATQVSTEEFPRMTGRVGVDLSTNLLKAEIQFPATVDSPPWLIVRVEQSDQMVNTTTRVEAVFDAEPASQEWLDSILVRSTGGMLTQVRGRLEMQADFAGQSLQRIEHLSLAAEKLQLVSHGGTLNLDTELVASREGEKVIVRLPAPAEIQYQDNTGWVDKLLTSAVPGLQRLPRSGAKIFSGLGSNSSFVFQPGTNRSARFNGDISFGLTSSGERVTLRATDFQVETEDILAPESTAANGLITLEWQQNAPFTYASEELELKADELSIAAELTSRDGKLLSTGGGTLMNVSSASLAASADRIDMTWQQLDLLNLAGKLGTKTQGFATEFEGETWTGFDFDVSYALLSNAAVTGSGTLKFDSGPQLPIEFAGNTQTERWDITVPSTTINLAQLGSLLAVAHFELPAAVKLNDGYIDLRGDVVVDDEITAKMVIKGSEMDVSMRESSARNASFTFNTDYGQTVSAHGPLSIEAVTLAGGVDVTHIRADLKLENTETFGLQNLYAEVFDGQLKLGSLRYSENRVEDTTVELSHINLARLLAFADIDGLQGTGALEISLPVGSDQAGVYIKNGTFSSAGPGRLAYTKEGVAGSNIGLQALENFQYQHLSGSLDYQSDGAYLIAVRLEGKNPDLYGGHPIVFNLNINGSVPELFEALFITGNFEESILNQIGIN